MRRFHLIELHEQPWFPKSWKEIMQLALGRGISALGVFDNLLDRFRDFLNRVKPDAMLDLCTGSGELAMTLWKTVTSTLEEGKGPKLVLSDLYPNIDSYTALRGENSDQVDFYSNPVDALEPPEDAPRVWTFYDSLHHFRPDDVREILRSAMNRADGIVVLESTSRSLKQVAHTLVAAPLVTVIMTVFVLRPVRLRNVVWGFLLPVIPLVTLFDGIVSNLRTHTVDELKEIIESIAEPGFAWDIGTALAPNSAGAEVTYLFGWRTQEQPIPL